MKGEFAGNSLDLKKPETIPQELYWQVNYLTPTRLSSIGYQWKLAIESKSSYFIEIGIGNGLLTSLLRAKNLNVITFDINQQLFPQVAGKLPEMPFSSKYFETVLCYEVLEHLPFETLGEALKEMVRISTNSIIISLPDRTGLYEPRGLKKIINNVLGRKSLVPLSSEHYWEIGHQQVNAEKIVEQATKQGLLLLKDFRNPHSMYHHFFVFELKY